jgi:colicin import membrane protein
MSLETTYNQQPLKPFLQKALLIHGGVLALLIILNLVGGISIFKKSNQQLKVLEDVVRVDIVGMPKFTLEELKKMDVDLAKTAPEPEVKVKETKEVIRKEDVVFEKKGKKKFSDLLKKFSQRKVNKKKKQKKKKIDDTTLNKLIMEGNQVSKGSRLVGTYSEEEQSLFAQYSNNLPNVIRPQWKLPSYLMEQELTCRIRIFINSTGELIRASLFQSSGNQEYDDRAIESIRKAAPFPIPDQLITKLLVQKGVILGFPL